jgi:DNA-binding LytR/AlgR family response regulator
LWNAKKILIRNKRKVITFDNMQILIIEDELLIAYMLQEMLIDLGHTITAICRNQEEALAALQTNNEINFCFIDINLNDQYTGIDIAKLINEKYIIPFAFLTSYSDKETIASAMLHQPEAYLIKPFNEIDLFATLEMITIKQKARFANKKEEFVIIKDGITNIKLKIEDILWIKSDNIYIEIKTEPKTYLIRTSLTKFLEEHNISAFVQTHRAYVVNINFANAITSSEILIGKEKIPLSRKYREEFLVKFR